MPNLVSLAIGGGTIVSRSGNGVALGPGSVGYRLTTEALVFGGAVPTPARMPSSPRDGPPTRSATRRENSPSIEDLLRRAIAACDARIEDGVDRVKTSGRELPLIAVGGGSGLIPETLAGVAGVHRAGELRRGQCHRRGDRVGLR